MFLKNKLNLFNLQDRHVRLQLLSTNGTGLQNWGYTRFTVMSSGEVVVWGKTSDKTKQKGLTLPKLFLKMKEAFDEIPPAFHIFSLTSTGWKKLREVKRLCDHDIVNILPVNIKNKEQLAVSCFECETIKLYNLDTLQAITSFHNLKYYPASMCHGENGKLCVVHGIKGDTKVLELDYSGEPFSGPSKIIPFRINRYYGLYYIPSPHKLLIITLWEYSTIQAVSAETGETVWEVKGEVDGKMCEPHGTLYSSRHQALLIADGRNRRVLVLEPQDGSHLQTIQLDQETGVIIELCLHQNKVVMFHTAGSREKISYFAIH